MNKKGVSLVWERIGLWIFIIVTMIAIIMSLSLYVFPKFKDAIPRLFG